MGRQLDPDAPRRAAQVPEDPRWDEVAERCLACTNCTMVCPTCFCSTTEDTTDRPRRRPIGGASGTPASHSTSAICTAVRSARRQRPGTASGCCTSSSPGTTSTGRRAAWAVGAASPGARSGSTSPRRSLRWPTQVLPAASGTACRENDLTAARRASLLRRPARRHARAHRGLRHQRPLRRRADLRPQRAADEFYVLRSGKVAVELDTPRRGPLVIETIVAGDVLGVSWLLPPTCGPSVPGPWSRRAPSRWTQRACGASATRTR